MLSNLHIENIAIIDNVNLAFGEGFQVLTGQTGAGKSIIIDSINLLTGERSSRELVRSGTEKGFVEGAVYTNDKKVYEMLDEAGIPWFDGDPLILSREISKDGRSVVRINSRTSTTGLLKSICSRIINIHGQNDNQAILDVSYHGEILDSYGKNDSLLAEYKKEYAEYKRIKKELESEDEDISLKEQKKEFLEFQIDEIEKAKLKVGEDDELYDIRNRYLNSEKIVLNLNEAYGSLCGDEESFGATQQVKNAMNSVANLSDLVDGAEELSKKLEEIYYLLDDASETVRDFKDNDDFEDVDINYVEERIDLINRLKKKYGGTVEEILSSLESFQTELLKTENSDEYKKKLEKELKAQLEKTNECADKLTKARKDAGCELAKQVLKQLNDLEMANVTFEVRITETELSPNGKDKIEFMISANAGEDLKPLNKVASGGELSRIILALKVILSKNDFVSTMIFDEVDTGVSGSAAQKIAEKIKAVSKEKQVFVITHLPQVAAFGDSHYLIEKEATDGKTSSKVNLLDEEGRLKEIARLLSGSVITENALNNARELISLGKDF